MTAHHQIFAPKRGTLYHRVLSLLAIADMEEAELRSACGTKDAPGVFARRIVFRLWDATLLQRLDKTRWRITREGRDALALLDATPDAAGCQSRHTGMRSRFEAMEPAAIPLTPGIERWMLTSSQGRARSMTEADKAPAPVRSDGMEFARHPSRRGNRLYYRDGRVTDMAGNLIEVAT